MLKNRQNSNGVFCLYVSIQSPPFTIKAYHGFGGCAGQNRGCASTFLGNFMQVIICFLWLTFFTMHSPVLFACCFVFSFWYFISPLLVRGKVTFIYLFVLGDTAVPFTFKVPGPGFRPHDGNNTNQRDPTQEHASLFQ